MPDRYYVRPGEPECVRWRDGPEGLDAEMEDRGLTKVDADCYEVHRRVQWNGRRSEGER